MLTAFGFFVLWVAIAAAIGFVKLKQAERIGALRSREFKTKIGSKKKTKDGKCQLALRIVEPPELKDVKLDWPVGADDYNSACSGVERVITLWSRGDHRWYIHRDDELYPHFLSFWPLDKLRSSFHHSYQLPVVPE